MNFLDHPDPGNEGLIHQHVAFRTELEKPMCPEEFREIAQHTYVPGLLEGLGMEPLGKTNIYPKSVSQCITTSHTREMLRGKYRILGDIHSCKDFSTQTVINTNFEAYGHRRWDATMVHRQEDENLFLIEGSSGYGKDVASVAHYEKQEVDRLTPIDRHLFPKHESPEIEKASTYHYMVDSFYENPLDQARAEEITKAIMHWRFDLAGIKGVGKINLYDAVDLTEPGWTWILDGLDPKLQEMMYSSDHHFSKPGEVNTRSDIFGYRQYTLAQVLSMMGIAPDSWNVTAIKTIPNSLRDHSKGTRVQIMRALGEHMKPTAQWNMSHAKAA